MEFRPKMNAHRYYRPQRTRLPRRRATVGIAIALLIAAAFTLSTSRASAVGPFADYTPPRTTNMNSCPGVAVVGFRGSGEAFDDGTLGLGGMGVKPLFDILRSRLGTTNVGASAVSYPAVPFLISPDQWSGRADLILQSFANLTNMLLPSGYGNSALTGENDGVSDITHLAARCPHTKIIVAGASQGAHVAKRALNRLNSMAGSHVSAVILMGDSSFAPNEPGVLVTGGNGTGSGIANLFFPTLASPLQTRYAGKIISACHNNDPVCRSGNATGVNGHDYRSDADALATWTINRLYPPPPPPPGSQPPCATFVTDVTIPDGSLLQAGSTLTKTWRIRNCGATAWSGMSATRISGTAGAATFPVATTPPGATGAQSMTFTVPTTPGTYRSTYKLTTSAGSSTGSFWVDFTVPAPPPTAHDCAAFVADVTVPDGTAVSPGESLNKIWHLRNCGNTNWSGLIAVHTDGAFGPTNFPVPVTASGVTAEVSTTITAPNTAGHYRTTYRLQAADGHYADNSFWIDINVSPPAPNRQTITSYDRMAPGAPYHGYFTTAWQVFTAKSNRIALLGVTVGNPALPSGQPVAANVTIRLCTDPNCSNVLAQGAPQITNYGLSVADISYAAVTPGATYYVVWYQPAAASGTTWVTYWWAGGPSISQSDQMQAVVSGYNG